MLLVDVFMNIIWGSEAAICYPMPHFGQLLPGMWETAFSLRFAGCVDELKATGYWKQTVSRIILPGWLPRRVIKNNKEFIWNGKNIQPKYPNTQMLRSRQRAARLSISTMLLSYYIISYTYDKFIAVSQKRYRAPLKSSTRCFANHHLMRTCAMMADITAVHRKKPLYDIGYILSINKYHMIYKQYDIW